MATTGEQIRGLRDFFLDAFTASDLEMFLTVNGYQEVVGAVNRNVGGSAYFFNVTQELDRRGLIDVAFFEHLKNDRPRKAGQISALRQLWLGEDQAVPEPSGSTASHAPPKPTRTIDRAALVRTISRFDPADMALFLAMIEGAAAHTSRIGTVREQAADLIRWAESATGPGLTAIQQALEDFR